MRWRTCRSGKGPARWLGLPGFGSARASENFAGLQIKVQTKELQVLGASPWKCKVESLQRRPRSALWGLSVNPGCILCRGVGRPLPRAAGLPLEEVASVCSLGPVGETEDREGK